MSCVGSVDFSYGRNGSGLVRKRSVSLEVQEQALDTGWRRGVGSVPVPGSSSCWFSGPRPLIHRGVFGR